MSRVLLGCAIILLSPLLLVAAVIHLALMVLWLLGDDAISALRGEGTTLTGPR